MFIHQLFILKMMFKPLLDSSKVARVGNASNRVLKRVAAHKARHRSKTPSAEEQRIDRLFERIDAIRERGRAQRVANGQDPNAKDEAEDAEIQALWEQYEKETGT